MRDCLVRESVRRTRPASHQYRTAAEASSEINFAPLRSSLGLYASFSSASNVADVETSCRIGNARSVERIDIIVTERSPITRRLCQSKHHHDTQRCDATATLREDLSIPSPVCQSLITVRVETFFRLSGRHLHRLGQRSCVPNRPFTTQADRLRPRLDSPPAPSRWPCRATRCRPRPPGTCHPLRVSRQSANAPLYGGGQNAVVCVPFHIEGGTHGHERTRRVRSSPGRGARRHARRDPLAGHLGPDRRGLRPDR